jgi:tRNA pseudouridine55 synthase
VVDKEAGWTSHDVVAKCRSIFGQRRVGHAGTLDPGATGVLLVGLGRVTRLMRFLTALPKIYEANLVFGVATTTLDASGEVVGRWDMSGLTPSRVRAAARRFVGEIDQVPPMVSAVRVGGRRLHELAREGVEVERPPRRVEVHELRVDPSDEAGVWRMSVVCSGGTYVRSLAADLGAALGGGAHVRDLRRLAVGSFHEREAKKFESLDRECVLTPSEALRDYARLEVPVATARRVAHGAVLERSAAEATGDGPWAVLDDSGRLLAVYEAAGADRLRPAVVLAS